MGKTRFAIQDFTRVLELKPDFTAARLQRGTVHMKNGEYQEAAADLEQVVSLTTGDLQLTHFIFRRVESTTADFLTLR